MWLGFGEKERFLKNEIMRLYYTQHFVTLFFNLRKVNYTLCVCVSVSVYINTLHTVYFIYIYIYIYTHTRMY